jgi:drug/metabolite transporter (DMT)-like permease
MSGVSSPTTAVVPARSPAVSGIAIVLGSAALFGMLGPLSRFAYDAGMQPTAFVAWRAGIGLIALGLFVAWGVRRGRMRLTRLADLSTGDRVTLLVAALMGFTLNLAMFIAFDRITIALALLGFYTYPAMVAVVSVALGRERMDGTRGLALVLAIVGMTAVVASQIDPASGIRFDVIGVALAFGAALSQTVYVVVSRDGYRSVPAEQAIVVVLGVSALGAILVAILTGAGASLTYPFGAPDVLPLLLFTGIVTAAIPSMGFLTGIRAIGGTRAGILMLFEPVVGVALAAWLLHEALVPFQVLGAVAILGAALLIQRSRAAIDDNATRPPVVPVGP